MITVWVLVKKLRTTNDVWVDDYDSWAMLLLWFFWSKFKSFGTNFSVIGFMFKTHKKLHGMAHMANCLRVILRFHIPILSLSMLQRFHRTLELVIFRRNLVPFFDSINDLKNQNLSFISIKIKLKMQIYYVSGNPV